MKHLWPLHPFLQLERTFFRTTKPVFRGLASVVVQGRYTLQARLVIFRNPFTCEHPCCIKQQEVVTIKRDSSSLDLPSISDGLPVLLRKLGLFKRPYKTFWCSPVCQTEARLSCGKGKINLELLCKRHVLFLGV